MTDYDLKLQQLQKEFIEINTKRANKEIQVIEVTEEFKCEKTGIIINYKIILFNKEKMVYKLIIYLNV